MRIIDWILVPRDKDGLVEWDKLNLPKADVYLAKYEEDYYMQYEAYLEFCSEGDLHGILAVLPLILPEFNY